MFCNLQMEEQPDDQYVESDKEEAPEAPEVPEAPCCSMKSHGPPRYVKKTLQNYAEPKNTTPRTKGVY